MEDKLDTVIEIATPEHLAFRARVAGPGRRAFAYFIDFVIRVLIGGGILLMLTILFAGLSLDGLGSGVMFLGIFALDWGYYVASELLTGGRSPGKILMKMRVVRNDGLPITWRESILRNLVRAADLVIIPGTAVLCPGILIMALDERFRRLGDFAAGTMVVVEDPVRLAKTIAITPNARVLEELPALLHLDRDDLEALELFVNREHVTESIRRRLAETVAPIYAERIGFGAVRDPAGFLGALWERAQGGRRASKFSSDSERRS